MVEHSDQRGDEDDIGQDAQGEDIGLVAEQLVHARIDQPAE